MADVTLLEAEVRRAEDELARARAWYVLVNEVPDAGRIDKLAAAVDIARAQLIQATPASVVPPDPSPAKPQRTGTLMGAETTGLEATVTLRMDRLATSMAHLFALQRKPLVTVNVENKTVDKLRRVSVRCHIEGYSAEVIASAELAKKGQPGSARSFDLFPPLFTEKVRELRELTAASLHVRVDDLDTQKAELIMAQAIPLLPPTSAVLGYRDLQTNQVVDQRELLAAYVTPNAPEIMELLRTAADGTKLKGMIGYQAMTVEEVRDQVRAIYGALAAANIVYVDSRVAFGSVAGETLQRIRLPRESLVNRSANCIDGTVLMASVLEATGLDPFIVIVPGHAYLGYRPKAGAASEDCEYVETTVISSRPFEDAVKIATDRSSNTPSIIRLDVRDARKRGITPME